MEEGYWARLKKEPDLVQECKIRVSLYLLWRSQHKYVTEKA